MKTVTAVVLVLLALAANAGAEEHNVPLKKGTRESTVWGVLKAEGCSTKQIATIWQVVVRDSGLEPKNDHAFTDGTLIVIRRDCDGALFVNTAVTAEIAKWRDANKKLDDEKAVLEGKNTKLSEELKKALANTNPFTFWLAMAELAGLAALSFLLYKQSKAHGMTLNALDVAREETRTARVALAQEKVERAKNMEFPPIVIVPQWEKTYTAKRATEPGSCKIYYVCPFCQAQISQAGKVAEHIHTVHGNEGRFHIDLGENSE